MLTILEVVQLQSYQQRKLASEAAWLKFGKPEGSERPTLLDD
jgi:hypothetical protein